MDEFGEGSEIIIAIFSGKIGGAKFFRINVFMKNVHSVVHGILHSTQLYSYSNNVVEMVFFCAPGIPGDLRTSYHLLGHARGRKEGLEVMDSFLSKGQR